MKLKLILTLLIVIISLDIAAQNNEHPLSDSEKHEHHKNEIGLGLAPVYFFHEEIFSFGLHLHYTRSIANTNIGLGLGYERIFDIHKHNTIGLVASYSPIDKLVFTLSPGLAFESSSSDAAFAMHVETSYEFEISNIHLGPVMGFAMEHEDYHISLGLHIGFGF